MSNNPFTDTGLRLDDFLDSLPVARSRSNATLPSDASNDSHNGLPSRQTSIAGLYAATNGRYVEHPSRVDSMIDRPRMVLPHDRPQRFPGSGSNARMVIAVDYGTTFTGLAYATTHSSTANPTDIVVLREWSATMSNEEKVRSMVSYSDPRSIQWGTDISENAVAISNSKLELEPRDTRIDELEATVHLLEGARYLSFNHIRAAGPEPAFTPRSPLQIVTDFLHEVRESACRAGVDIDKLKQTDTPVDLVITVPVNWSYEAKNLTFKAFRRAGFSRQIFPTLGDTILVHEPEAASYFAARDIVDTNSRFLQANQCYILCDAGGGTVDVVSYQVTQAEDPLELKKITIPESGRCGSVFIDLEFKCWLRDAIGPRNYNMLDPTAGANGDQRIYPYAAEGGALRSLIRQFEAQKKLFQGLPGDIKLDMPPPLNKLTIDGRVREGELTITRDEMAQIFAECVNGVLTLIDEQIARVGKAEWRVKSVILVGGFGASPYLQQMLRRSLEMRKIRLQRPDPSSSWTAVVRGAVIYGIEKDRHDDAVFMVATLKSYGLMTNPNGRFEWLVRKGDLTLSSSARVLTSGPFYVLPEQYKPTGRFELPIYEYKDYDEDDDVPEFWQTGQHEVEPVLRVKCNVANVNLRNLQEPLANSGDGLRGVVSLGPLTCQLRLVGARMSVVVRLQSLIIGQGEMDVPTDRA